MRTSEALELTMKPGRETVSFGRSIEAIAEARANFLTDRDILDKLGMKTFLEASRNKHGIAPKHEATYLEQILETRRSYSFEKDKIPSVSGYYINGGSKWILGVIVNHERLSLLIVADQPELSYQDIYDYALFRDRTPLLSISGRMAEVPLGDRYGNVSEDRSLYSKVRKWMERYRP